MCGIIGEFSIKSKIDYHLFESMRDTLFHRGPDGSGAAYFLDDRVALGHRRLSIVDLSENGSQPMSNEDKTVWITFNGEIYNYQSLRKILEQNGHLFKSTSDTEVIIHGYEEWGIKILQKLEGMFAFCIWDDSNRSFFLARDRFGIKPLYYYKDEERFIFSSELKGILRNPKVEKRLNVHSLTDFLVYRFVPSPRSIWKSIMKLEPGQYLTYTVNDGIKLGKYWSLTSGDETPGEQVVGEQTESLLRDAIKSHMISDVPVGVLLSGGFDSSLVTSMMTEVSENIRSFSIGFDRWDKSEHVHARIAAQHFGTEHSEEILKEAAISNLHKLSYYFDEPLGGSSFIPTYMVSRLASSKVKVVLSGDGGDELFAGYTWHRKINKLYYESGLKQRIKRAITGRSNYLLNTYFDLMSWSGYRYDDMSQLLNGDLIDVEQNGQDNLWLYKKYLNNKFGPVRTFQLLDFHSFLPEVVLTKVDRASMANSLEVRVPFLDTSVVSYVMNLSENVVFNPSVNKTILNYILKKRLPSSLLKKPKQGFGAPVRQVSSFVDEVDILYNSKIITDRIVERKYVERLIEINDQRRLWPLFILAHWGNTWL